MLPAMLAGYLFLLIFRPYEYWPILGTLRVERVYMIVFIIMVMVSEHKRWIKSPVNACVGVFVAVLTFSSFFAFNVGESLDLLIDYLKYVVFYVVVVLSINNKKDFRNIILIFLAVMFLYVGKSAWEFFVNGRYEFTMGIKRMVGVDMTYGAPNSFAASICYSLPFVWAVIRFGEYKKWIRLALWSYGALAVVSIIYTGSRSGMATLLLFFVLAVFSSSKKVIALLVMGALLVIGWDFIPADLQTRFISTYEKGHAPASADESAEGRLAGFLQGAKVFAQHPLLGIGPANFQFSWPGVARGYNAHNLYGQIMGELGLAGVATFGLLLLVVYRTNGKVISLSRKEFPGLGSRRESAKPAKSRGPGRGAPSPAKQAAQARAARRALQPSASGAAVRREPVPAMARAQAPGAPVQPHARRHAGPGLQGGLADSGQPLDPFAPDARKAGHEAAFDPVREGYRRSLLFFMLIAQAVNQTIILMLFKGWGDHNLYRYTWLWLAAVTVLCDHLLRQEVKDHGKR